MNEASIEKTAFCPGPGYGLWEFTVMPYRLTVATQPCQQGLDKVMKDCKDCVDKIVLSFMIACSPTLLTFNVSLVRFYLAWVKMFIWP